MSVIVALGLFAVLGWSLALIQTVRHTAATAEPKARIAKTSDTDPRPEKRS